MTMGDITIIQSKLKNKITNFMFLNGFILSKKLTVKNV